MPPRIESFFSRHAGAIFTGALTCACVGATCFLTLGSMQQKLTDQGQKLTDQSSQLHEVVTTTADIQQRVARIEGNMELQKRVGYPSKTVIASNKKESHE